MKIERNDLKDQEIQFTITASADDITNAKDQALEFLGKEINVPGFRKGKAPAKEIRSRVGELRLLQEAIEILVDLGYRQVLEENKELFPLVEPRIDIKDEDSLIAEESQFVFDLIITNRPEVTLPDYAHLSVDYSVADVSDEDVDEAIKDLFERWKSTVEQDSSKIETATSLADAKDKAKEGSQKSAENLVANLKDQPDDEWAQMLGAGNMEDLRLKLHSNLILEKTYEAGNKFTQDVLDTLYKKTTVSLPNKLIHDDLEKRKQKKAEDLEKIGLDLEGFAKQQKMTLEELENKWLEDIEKEYTLEFAIAEIGEKENVTVSDEEVESEINASKSSETMQLFQDPHRKEHLRYLMRRDKVIGKIVEMNFPELEKDSDKEEQKPKKKTKKS